MTGLKKRTLAILFAAILTLGAALPAQAAASLKTNLAKSVFKLVNQERDEAGLLAYTWDADLAQAAELRAKEIVEKYDPDHKRPSGAKYFTVSTKVWGENIAYGPESATEVMGKWMRSTGHRENILMRNFTIIGVGCAAASDGTLYWVQLFGNGKTNTGWTGAKEYTYDPFGQEGITIKSDKSLGEGLSDAQKLGGLVLTSGEVGKEKALSELQAAVSAGQKAVTITAKNPKSIKAETLSALSEAAGKAGVSVTVVANTLDESGKSVQGQMVLQPSLLTKRTTGIKLGVSVDSAAVKHAKERTEQKYSGAMAYIHMEHQGALGAKTEVCAKVSLTGMKKKQLRFYVYDWDKEQHVLIPDPSYSVDQLGYLHFYTATAGDIVIADYDL